MELVPSQFFGNAHEFNASHWCLDERAATPNDLLRNGNARMLGVVHNLQPVTFLVTSPHEDRARASPVWAVLENRLRREDGMIEAPPRQLTLPIRKFNHVKPVDEAWRGTLPASFNILLR